MQALNKEQIAGMLATIAGQLAAEPAKPAGPDLRRLAEPFPIDAVSWRIGSTNSDKNRGMALAYIDARDVMDRLDAVVGPGNWRDEYTEIGGFFVCKLWLRIGDEWVWKCDGAGKTDVEAEKGMVSDSFKRAAVKWGIGRYLYNLDSPWVPIKAAGRSHVITDEGHATLQRVLAKHAAEHYKRSRPAAQAEPEPPPAPAPQQAKAPEPPQPAQPAPAAQAVPASTGHIAQPDGEPTAATLINGTPHNEGLRAVSRRMVEARQALEANRVLPDERYGKKALDTAFNAWTAWRQAMWPHLPEAEQKAVLEALAGWSKVAKRFDAVWEKHAKKRAEAAQAAAADPSTGEIMEGAA